MKFPSKNILIPLVFILLFSLVPLFWFHNNEVLVGHDNVYPLDAPVFLRDRLFTWSEHHGTGYDQSQSMGSIGIHIIDSTPSLFHIGLPDSQKIVYVFWVAALLVSSFLLIYCLEKWGYIRSKSIKIFLPLLYTFNFYTLQGWWIGERTKFSVMVALPLLLAILFSLLHNKRNILQHAALAALVLFVFNGGGFRGAPLFGGMFIVIGLFVVYFGINLWWTKKYLLLSKFGLFFIVFGFLLGLLDAYSMLPFLSQTLSNYNTEIQRIGGASNTFGWLDMISMDASPINLLRFEGIPEWYTDPFHPYGQTVIHNPLMILFSFTLITFIFLSFIFRKKEQEEKVFYFFLFVFLISIFFVEGSYPPIGYLYKEFVKIIPGFAIFRSPLYKFGYAMWLSGAFLASYGLSACIDQLASHVRFRKLAISVCIILFSCSVLAYHYPFITGTMFRWSKGRLATRVTIPPYVYDVASWANTIPDSSRILLLPEANSSWTADTYTWKFYSLYPLMADLSRRPFLYNHDGLTEDERALVDQLYQAILSGDTQTIDDMSTILGVDYFIVRDDYYWNLDWTPTVSPQEYTKAITHNNYFVKVKTIGKWHIYKSNHKQPQPAIKAWNTVSLYNSNTSNMMQISDVISKIYALNPSHTGLVAESLHKDAIGINPKYIENEYSFTNCTTCDLLKTQYDISFPDLYILPNSPLYRFTNHLEDKKVYSDQQSKLFDLLGRTLTYVEQIYQLSFQYDGNKREIADAINGVSGRLADTYKDIALLEDPLFKNPQQRIVLAPEILEYIRNEEGRLDYVLNKYSDSLFADELIEPMKQLKYAKVTLEAAAQKTDYYNSFVFFPQNSPGSYGVFIQSIRAFPHMIIDSNHISAISQTNDLSSFGSQKLRDSSIVKLPDSQMNMDEDNVVVPFEDPHDQDTNTCFGKVIQTDQSASNFYRANLTISNAFSNRLKFIVFPYNAEYKKYKFTKTLYSYSIARVEEKSQVISQVLNIRRDNPQFFVGICSPSLTADIAQTAVTRFDIYQIQSPILITRKNNSEELKQAPPRITVKKINQTKYLVSVKNAHSPFFLSFDEKYNTDWRLYELSSPVRQAYNTSNDQIIEPTFFETWNHKNSENMKHFKAQGYENAWYVEKTGDFDLMIEYKPQRLFYQGLIVTVVGGFLTALILLYGLLQKIKKH